MSDKMHIESTGKTVSKMVPFDSVQTGVEEKQMNQDRQALNADRVVTGHYF